MENQELDYENYTPAQKAEVELENTQKHLESVIEKFKTEDDNYAEYLAERKKIEDALLAVERKIREIERNRFQRNAEIKRAERERDAAKLQYEEEMRNIALIEQRKSYFTNTTEKMKNAGFEWVKFAYPHQWSGALTLSHFGSGILGDGTGTGKTLTATMIIDMLEAKKVLIITPPDVVSGFFDNLKLFAPHRNVLPLESANPVMRNMAKTIAETSNEFTFVVNYEALWRDSSWVDQIEWDVLVMDEAHVFKNAKGLSFDRLSGIPRKHTFPMTATSILNSPEDIWTSLHMVDPMRFDDRFAFLAAYCRQDYNGKWVFKEGGEAAMLRSLGGRVVKRSMEETGIKLPPQTIRELLIPAEEITERQQEVIKQLNDYATIQLETGESASIDAMIALITRQRQSVVYPAGIHIKATEKDVEYNPNLEVGQTLLKVPEDMPSVVLDKAVERLTYMKDNNIRSVVFSQFKTALVDLQARLEAKGLRVARYDGDTKKDERLKIKRDFLRSADGKRKEEFHYDVVLANFKTGGVGLTFTEATYMLMLDEEWNPAKNGQAMARIHRIGQTEQTLVEILRVDKTISMWMKSLNEQKALIVAGLDAEINMLDQYKEYMKDVKLPVENKPVLAIEAPVEEEEILEAEIVEEKEETIEVDDDFMALLAAMEDND